MDGLCKIKSNNKKPTANSANRSVTIREIRVIRGLRWFFAFGVRFGS